MSAELDRQRRVLPLTGEAAIGARDILAERRHSRGMGLVAQQPIDPFLGEAFLPAPDVGLGRPSVA